MSNQETLDQLFNACKQGRIRKVQELLAKLDDIDFINDHKGINGKTLLQEAAESHRLGIVKVLLDKGADVNAVSNANDTALHIAATNGDTDIINLLLSRNADIKKLDGIQRSPIETARVYKRIRAEKVLKTAGKFVFRGGLCKYITFSLCIMSLDVVVVIIIIIIIIIISIIIIIIIIIIIRVLCVSGHFCSTRLFLNSSYSSNSHTVR